MPSDPPQASRFAAAGYAAWICAALYAAFGNPRLGDALLLVELLAAALVLRRSATVSRRLGAIFWVAALAHLAASLATIFPGVGENAAALARGMRAIVSVLAPSLFGSFAGIVLRAAWPLLALAAAIGAPAFWLLRHRPRLAWRLPAYAFPAMLAVALTREPDKRAPEVVRIDLEAQVAGPGWQGLLRPARPLPALAQAGPRAPSVVLVLLESVGKRNLEEHERGHPGCLFSRWRQEGLTLATVIPVSSVSHIAQPGVLASHVALRPPGNTIDVQKVEGPLLTAQAFFHAKGYRAAMHSSQDERWMGLHRVSLSPGWTSKADSAEAPPEARYADPCGINKVLDSHTAARAAQALQGPGPAFVYVNLQDTHFPYVVEGAPGVPRLPAFSCGELWDASASSLPELRRRYELALRETEARVESLRRAAPQAVFLVSGDHGESFVAGSGFGHGKDTSAGQDETTAFLLGPGAPRRLVAQPVSALDLLPTLLDLVAPADLRALDPQLLSGASALREAPPGPILTSAQGFTNELACVLNGRKLRYTPGRAVSCSTLEDAPVALAEAGCGAARKALLAWLGCQTDFYRDAALAASHYNPCLDVARRAARVATASAQEAR